MGSIRLSTEVNSENPVLGDLEIGGSNFVYVGFNAVTDEADNGDLIRQRIQTYMSTIAGEWFLDQKWGFPYLERVFRKTATTARVKADTIKAILRVPGVKNVTVGAISIDTASRRMIISDVVCRTDNGDTVTLDEINAPFHVRTSDIND
jgi:hypothetical protein